MMKKNPKIVAIGGGTGLSTLLKGLKCYTNDITAIVSVTDSGGSTGILRQEYNILALGDLRKCIVALSDGGSLISKIFDYRFSRNGTLHNHNLGNLIMTSLIDITKSENLAIKKTSRILKIKGTVLPVTLDNCQLYAKLEDGSIIQGEEDIDIPKHNPELKIKKVFLDKEAKLFEPCKKTIFESDLIIIGPGDLYTSIIPNFLVKDMKEAIKDSNAKKVYVCNLMTKYGETTHFKTSDFVKEVNRYLGGNVIDYVILNKEMPNKRLLEVYSKQKSIPVKNNFVNIKKSKFKVIQADLLDKDALNSDLIRHDSIKLANLLTKLK